MNDTDLITKTTAAALLGKSKAWVSHAGTAGKLGPAYVEPGTKFKKYSIAAIEHGTGQKFTAEQIAAARRRHSYKAQTNPIIISGLLRRLIVAALAARDDQWLAKLAKQGVTGISPPPKQLKDKPL